MAQDRSILITNRTNSQDVYEPGDLSLFPQSLDDDISLYQASNNAISVLTGYVPANSTLISVKDNGFFADQGIIRINDELIYYNKKENNGFSELIRGFNASRRMNHSVGSVVLGCVSALHHNSLRDSILKSQGKTGLRSDLPDINGTLTSRLKYLDIKWFTPVSRFIAFPLIGRAPLVVNFKSWALGEPFIDVIWDFGDLNDPTSSTEKNPTHTFTKPGLYSITLTIKSSDRRGAHLTKQDYISVMDENAVYDPRAYSRDPISKNKLEIDSFGRAKYDNRVPLTVEFVDQTLGLVKARRWNFGDGEIVDVNTNPYDHIIQHTYTTEGIYWPEIQVLDQHDTLRTYSFKQPIIVGLQSFVLLDELKVGSSLSSKSTLTKHSIGDKSYKNTKDELNAGLII